MTIHQTQSIKSILLLAGSFTFAFLLGEIVHEYGHYLGHLAYGNLGNVQVRIDPFGDSRIMGVTSLPDQVLGVTSATGPLFNLSLAVACLLFLWRIRIPSLLSFLLWGPVAMIQEGVTFSLGMMTPGGDAQWIAAMGISKLILVLTGSFLLIAGIKTISLLLPLTDIRHGASFKDKFLIILLGMCSLMVVRFIHSFAVSPASRMENMIPLILSLILAVVITLSYKPSIENIQEVSQKNRRGAWPTVTLALTLGLGMFLVQLILLN